MANAFIGRIKVLLGMDTGEFKKGVQKGKKEMSGFQKWSKGWAGQMVATLGAAFAIGKLVEFGKEIVRLSGEMQGVKNAFDNLGRAGLLDELRAATKGTVSDLNLMKQAVSAKNLGLPIEQLGRYFEFARRRAKETGESVEYLSDSIVKGIGRKSPLILDNLGISTVALNEELKKTPDFATAVGNIIEKEFGTMASDIDTTAEATARVSASWENYMTQLGGNTTGIINSATKALNDLLTTITETDAATEKAGKLGFGRKAFSELDATSQKFVEFNKLVNDNASEFAANETSVKKLNAALRYFKEQADNVNRGTDEGRVQLISYSEAMKTISSRIGVLTSGSKGSIPAMTDAQIKLALEARNASLNLDSLKDSVSKLNPKFKQASNTISELNESLNKDLETDKLSTVMIPVKVDLTAAAITMDGLENGVTNKMLELGEAVSAELNSALAGIAGAMVDTLALAFEGASAEDLATVFLTSFADILGQFGKMMISLGLGLLAFNLALESLNPAVAIGAGVALIAAAGAIKGFLKGSANGGGGGGSQSGGGFGGGGSTGNGLQNFENPTGGEGQGGGEFRIRGKDLVLLSNRVNTTNNLTT